MHFGFMTHPYFPTDGCCQRPAAQRVPSQDRSWFPCLLHPERYAAYPEVQAASDRRSTCRSVDLSRSPSLLSLCDLVRGHRRRVASSVDTKRPLCPNNPDDAAQR